MNVKIIRQTKSKITSILPNSQTSEIKVISENGDVYEYDYLRQRSHLKSSSSSTSKVIQVGHISSLEYKLRSDHTLKLYRNASEVFEMPINTLNFSNIILFQLKDDVLVISVSTTDADKFDVYRIFNVLREDGEEITMKRLLRLMAYEGVHTGNIMNFGYVKNNLFVGYEDGSVIKYKLSSEFDKVDDISVIFDFGTFGDESHEDRDHPVLKIKQCENRECVFFTHAKVSELYYYNLVSSSIEKLVLPENISINHLVEINNSIYFSCWENNFVYKADNENVVSIFYTISIKPNIQLVDIDPVADTSEMHPYKDLDRSLSKVSCLYKVSKDDIQQHYLGLQSKVLLKRFSKVLQNDYLYIGLESGNLIELSF